ncbi:DNA-binding transcriptional regulator, MarR family [Salinihabitans flavidus]|uniref:DNA-binding transcriptional regulator, MarR family n=1 Tax=Salinihabitans flavidus TaxID=569882 RepID=A0A1H8U4Q0_9RHOB|nr:MarR family transcriptional regulator [Salinihabitans flavidus]SEO98151.1 DNA-binding transcriptional regulator, MarR family [Salinihabitans flavidus]
MSSQATQDTDWILGIDPPEYLLAATTRQIREMMNTVLRRHGLKLVEWRILQSLEAEGALSILDLADRAVIDRTVTSRLIDRMVARGLVAKTALETDRRFSRVTLSDAGRDTLAACQGDVDRARAGLFDGLSRDEVAALTDALQTLASNAMRQHHRR